ncbi:MAG: DNA recombination protein RmuC [Victivallaceae bacterium]
MEILFLITGLVVAGFFAWFIAKYKFSREATAAPEETENLKNELNTALSNYKVECERTRSLGDALKTAEAAIEQKTAEINQLTGRLSASETAFANINAQYQELKTEHNRIKVFVDSKNEEIQKLNVTLSGTNASLESAQNMLKSQAATLEQQKQEIRQKTEENAQLNQRVSTLNAGKTFLEEKLGTQKNEIEEIRVKFQTEFQNIANKIMEEKSQKFTEMNKSNIELILKPLGENLDSFKKKVEETYDKESKQRFSLEEKIKDLVALNNQISADANNLTNALKGQAKTQGNWGEMILESILEKSGLTKGREYSVQESIRDHDGNLLKPDVIINYPDNRKVVIDSKVSLVAYERFASAEDKAQQEIYLDEHIKSIKAHIDSLSSKNYQDYVESLDFTMMFVPIEPAYMFAMQKDHTLWNYAYAKRILLISPTNLIAALKLIVDLWKRDYQNKNTLAIADQGAKLYDKFVSFVETLLDIGKHIEKTHNSYEEAMKLLKDGRGNLIGQSHKLIELRVKAKKSLPPSLLADSICDDEIEELEPASDEA